MRAGDGMCCSAGKLGREECERYTLMIKVWIAVHAYRFTQYSLLVIDGATWVLLRSVG